MRPCPRPPDDEGEGAVWAWVCVAGLLVLAFWPWVMRWVLSGLRG
jgi:hypothetical protein